MREILFCGKRLDNGEWVQGFLVIWGNDYYIAPDINAYTSMGGRGKGRCMMFGHYYQVLPETVGQYTGLTDKNGKKIFEGDIIKICGQHSCFDKVEFLDGLAGFYAVNDDIHIPAELVTLKKNFIEVIDNIHDNPEMLEVAE